MSLWKHPFTVITVFVLCIAFWLSLWANTREIRNSLNIISSLEGQIDSASQENQALKEKLEVSRSADAQEIMIRNELVMQKPGEYIVQLPDLPSPSTEPIAAPRHPSAWEQWQQLLR